MHSCNFFLFTIFIYMYVKHIIYNVLNIRRLSCLEVRRLLIPWHHETNIHIHLVLDLDHSPTTKNL